MYLGLKEWQNLIDRHSCKTLKYKTSVRNKTEDIHLKSFYYREILYFLLNLIL